MKKIYIPYIVFCILMLTLFVINLNKQEHQIDIEVNPQVSKRQNINTGLIIDNDDSKDKFYVIKAKDNNIFLLDNNENTLKKLDIDYLTLREYDKNQFLNGIKVTDMEEVYQLIEDFSN